MNRDRMIETLKMIRDLALFDPTTGECKPTNELNAVSAEALDMAIKELETPAIPISYINSRISRLRQHKTYAGDFGADFLEAIIKDYNKEVHND